MPSMNFMSPSGTGGSLTGAATSSTSISAMGAPPPHPRVASTLASSQAMRALASSFVECRSFLVASILFSSSMTVSMRASCFFSKRRTSCKAVVAGAAAAAAAGFFGGAISPGTLMQASAPMPALSS
eukprot:4026003-Pyramimonas_sp.AAC.1